MASRRRKALRWVCGLVASITLNLLLLSGVGLRTPALGPQPASDRGEPVEMRLVAPPKPQRVRPSPRRPPSSATSRPTPSAPDRKAVSAVAPPLAAPLPPPSPSPEAKASPDADMSDRVGQALRGLSACAQLEPGRRQDPLCAKLWSNPSVALDPVSPRARAEYGAAGSRTDDAVANAAKLRGELRDHGGQGNNAHFGCTITADGKIKCSTY